MAHDPQSGSRQYRLHIDTHAAATGHARAQNLIVQVDLEKKKLEDVVAAWIKDNEARWKAWLQ